MTTWCWLTSPALDSNSRESVTRGQQDGTETWKFYVLLMCEITQISVNVAVCRPIWNSCVNSLMRSRKVAPIFNVCLLRPTVKSLRGATSAKAAKVECGQKNWKNSSGSWTPRSKSSKLSWKQHSPKPRPWRRPSPDCKESWKIWQ